MFKQKDFFYYSNPRAFVILLFEKKNFFFSFIQIILKKGEQKKITILNDISEAFRAKTSHTQILLFFSHIYFELFNLENQFEWERHTNQK